MKKVHTYTNTHKHTHAQKHTCMFLRCFFFLNLQYLLFFKSLFSLSPSHYFFSFTSLLFLPVSLVSGCSIPYFFPLTFLALSFFISHFYSLRLTLPSVRLLTACSMPQLSICLYAVLSLISHMYLSSVSLFLSPYIYFIYIYISVYLLLTHNDNIK